MDVHVNAIFQIYIGGPLAGSMIASLICCVMWCGCRAPPQLPTFNSLQTRRQSYGGRNRLRLKPRVVQYVAVSHSHAPDDVDRLSAGGPPVCYFCDGCTVAPLSANKNTGLLTRTGGTL